MTLPVEAGAGNVLEASLSLAKAAAMSTASSMSSGASLWKRVFFGGEYGPGLGSTEVEEDEAEDPSPP